MSGIRITMKSGDVEFGVMSIPNRKQKALYQTRGANIDILAYFRSDGCAEEFETMLNWIIREFRRVDE